MTTISLRVSDDELRAFKTYASINNWSLSDAIRKTMIEKIEDEYDMQVFAEYEEQKAQGKLTNRPIDELWNEVGI